MRRRRVRPRGPRCPVVCATNPGRADQCVGGRRVELAGPDRRFRKCGAGWGDRSFGAARRTSLAVPSTRSSLSCCSPRAEFGVPVAYGSGAVEIILTDSAGRRRTASRAAGHLREAYRTMRLLRSAWWRHDPAAGTGLVAGYGCRSAGRRWLSRARSRPVGRRPPTRTGLGPRPERRGPPGCRPGPVDLP